MSNEYTYYHPRLSEFIDRRLEIAEADDASVRFDDLRDELMRQGWVTNGGVSNPRWLMYLLMYDLNLKWPGMDVEIIQFDRPELAIRGLRWKARN